MVESKCDFDLAFAWCLSAKNNRQNVNGFTSFQIARGENPTFPVAIDNALPANSSVCISDIVRENLNAIYSAWKAYIETENSHKIKLALSHNVSWFLLVGVFVVMLLVVVLVLIG